ncbi:long-chain-fatty-acid--CoA ligase [Nocardioides sp. LML1-1-1.1]|uniref:long-chain-fatty-acid--CoA ligase n=1 Tax=Nocardioides sp. LML1-1-1.1 TaxID=3135248 RepID=UPI00341E1C26
MHLTQSLHRRVQADPDGEFTTYQGRVTSNAEMADRAARIAGGLHGLRVKPGDRVALLDLNTDYFFHASVAIAWADAVIVPVNYRWSVKEMAYSLNEADVEVLIVGDAFLAMVDELRAASPGITTVIHVGDAPTPEGMVTLDELLAAEPVPDAERGGDSLLGIFYTGGTTGFPKGVMLSHRGVMLSCIGSIAMGRYPRGGRCLLVAPAFHLAGFANWCMSMLLEQGGIPLPEFTPTGVMQLIEDDEVTSMTLVPTMIQMVVDHPERDRFDLSGVQLVVYGASPISDALLDRARKAFPSARFCQAYGMTELSPCATILSDEDHADPQKRRSAGRPMVYSLCRIAGPDDVELARGEVGEIQSKGDHVMLGYWKKPEETEAALRGGWMHTGDGGYMDEDGYVYVVDRIKDMIISGGENVYSIEVENAIAKHPAIVQCAVIGLADDKWGERVHAIVQLAPAATLSLEELREFAKKQIAGYKCPQSLEFVDAWPLSGAGKILKRELRRARA